MANSLSLLQKSSLSSMCCYFIITVVVIVVAAVLLLLLLHEISNDFDYILYIDVQDCRSDDLDKSKCQPSPGILRQFKL